MSAEKLPPNGTPNPFTDDETGMFELLLEQAGTIAELSRESDEYAMRALRFDEGVACLQWWLSSLMKGGSVAVKAPVMETVLRELAVFGATGREPGWLRLAREEMGR